jgi:hypothetical protein
MLTFRLFYKIKQNDEYRRYQNDSYQTFISYRENEVVNKTINNTEYFRPSQLPILNDREFKSGFLGEFYMKEPNEIILPNYLLESPEDSIINFFSILRHAANYVKGKGTGCGTLGYAKLPYPVAYNFLSPNYQERLSYDDFLALFENILHLNLIKLHLVPNDKICPDGLRYFIEFETIEGSEKDVAYFAYYYGYICLTKVDETYKIANLNFKGEDYLCAPYHGWNYIAEAVVDIKYGNWCSLVQKRYETQQDNYIKNIYFKGTDGYEYCIQFFQLTNGTDIEIAQYRKNKKDEWELININPEDCLDINKKS